MPIHPSKALSAALLAQIAVLGTVSAQTTWDGGGLNTHINNAANWDNDVVNALNGTQNATFGTGGSGATLNVAAAFGTVVLNRNDAGGFAIGGSSNLTLTASTTGATPNLQVGNTAGNGSFTISAPLRVNTDPGGTRLLVIDNREADTAGASLALSGGISATTAANGYGIRAGGAGSTRIQGTIANLGSTNIQQASISGNRFSGTLAIVGNQSLGTSNVLIGTTGGNVDGLVDSSARIVMGGGTADVQSWGSTSVLQAGTVEVKSTATLAAGVSLSNSASNGSSGGTLEVSGNLTATTLAIGGAAYSGVLKVSGAAAFSGAVTSGATAGSKIVGGAATNGTLTLASGTIGSAVAIGGAGANENNLALVKTTTGTLTINSANNPYAGGTTLADGGGSGSFGLALGAHNALGTGPLTLGTAATGTNGARLRMAGFSQTVSALSSGNTSNARVIENFGAANSTLTVNGAGNGAYAGSLRDRSTSSATATGKLGLVKDGAGTLVLSNTSNQYTGSTVINGGVLEVTSLSNGGIAKTITSTASNSTVTVADTTGVTAGMTFVAATLPTGFSVSLVPNGTDITISTTSGIVTGNSTAHFGTASSIGLSTNAASNLVFGGGTLRYTGGNSTTDRHFTINSGQSAKWDVSNAATVLTLTGGSAASAGGFEKLGAGSLVLSGAQAHTGDTLVSAGRLVLGASDRLSNSSKLVLAGGTFDLNGFSETLGALSLTAGSAIDLGATGAVGFADSSNQSWGSFALSFSGTLAATSVKFGVDGFGLTTSQLALITVNGLGGWTLDSSGYLTAIPEPSAFAALAGLGALGGAALRRRRRG